MEDNNINGLTGFKIIESRSCAIEYLKDILLTLSSYYEDYCFSDSQLLAIKENCKANRISCLYERMNNSDGQFFGYKLIPLVPHRNVVTAEPIFVESKYYNNYSNEWSIKIIVPRWAKKSNLRGLYDHGQTNQRC